MTEDKLLTISGSGGGGSSSSGGTEQPTSAQCNTIATLFEFLCEGEIYGPAISDSWYKSTYFNDTVVQESDDSFNFDGVTIAGTYGTYDQNGFDGVDEATSVTQVNLEVVKDTPITHAVTDTNVNDVIVTIMLPSLYIQNDKGDIKETTVNLNIYVQPSGGSYVLAQSVTITEKFNATYMRDYRLSNLVGSYGAGPWNIRVERVTEDADSVKVADKTFFYSITECIKENFSYPNSVILKYTFDAQEFGTSAPTRTTKIKGLKVHYPDTYDPETRSFTGEWDGNMDGYGYSNNPAWFIYAVLTNDVWGMGIDPNYVDIASLYQIAAYCDGSVDVTERVYQSDGTYTTNETTEPRFTLNVNIEQRKEALAVLKDVCGACRCYPLWYGSYVTFIQDRPYEGNIMVASSSNVVGGDFVYSNTSMDSQHNTVEVTYNDPTNFGKQKTVAFSDDENVDKYGVIKKSVTLVGCTSRTEALRRAKYILYTDLYETRMVQFVGGIEWIGSKPGDVIAVQDEHWAGIQFSGRIASATSTSINIDREVTIESGKTYTLRCQSTGGDTFEKELTNTSGDHTTLYWSEAVTDLPPVDGVWVIEASDLSLQYFRIASITPGEDDDVFKYTITATTYDENKYQAVEGDFFYEAPRTSLVDTGALLPPSNLSITPHTYQDGDDGPNKYAMWINWEHSTDERRTYYELQYAYNDSGFTELATETTSSYDYRDVQPGTYDIRVRARGLSGRSPWITYYDYVMLTTTSGVLPPTGLQVKGGGTEWSGRDCEIEWTTTSGVIYNDNEVGDANVKGYFVEVRDTDGTLLRTANTGKYEGEFTYTYEMNNTDHDGDPQRSLRFDVYTVDIYNNLSSSYATDVFTNPAPDMSAATPEISEGASYFVINWNAPEDTDMSHYVVYVGTTNPPATTSGTTVNYPATNTTVFGLTYGTTYYVKIYPYDAFGVGTPTGVESGSPTKIPAENVDVELQNSVIYTDNASTADTSELYDGEWTSGGVTYTSTGWNWIQVEVGLEDYINGVQLWASSGMNVCVGISTDNSTWSYFGGDGVGGLTLVDGVYRLTEYGSLSAAQSSYWTTDADFDYAFMPNNITAKYCRLYFYVSSSVSIYELVFRRIVIAEDMAVEQLSAITVDAGTITAGLIQSDDYSTNTGFLVDLNNDEIYMGGSTGASLKYDDSGGLVINGQVTFTNGSTGYTNISDAPTTLSELDSSAGSKLNGIEYGADVTANNTAASIDGQGSLATKNSVAYSSEVTGTPTSLNDINSTEYSWASNPAGRINTQTTTINGGKLTTGTVTANKIVSNSITAGQLAANCITASEVGANQIIANAANIKNAIITGAKLANATVTNAKIANAAITNAKIGSLAVSTIKIQDQAVTMPISYKNAAWTSAISKQTWGTVATCSITSYGGGVLLLGQCGIRHNGGNDKFYNCKIGLWRGGTLLCESKYFSVGNGYDIINRTYSATENPFLFWVDTPGSGTYTYYLKLYGITVSYYANNRNLFVFEAKK